MKDYRIEVKVKNNILYRLMKRKGIETPAELARKRNAVSDMLKTLTKREETVMRSYYGIDEPQQTLSEIARNVEKMTGHKVLTGEKGISKERMRQIILKAERKLNHPTRKRIVRDFL